MNAEVGQIPKAVGRSKKKSFDSLQRANSFYDQAMSHQKSALENFVECGRALNQAKTEWGSHGKWENWVRQHFVQSKKTAESLMYLANNWSDVEPEVKDGKIESKNQALAYLRKLNGPTGPVKRNIKTARRQLKSLVDKVTDEAVLSITLDQESETVFLLQIEDTWGKEQSNG